MHKTFKTSVSLLGIILPAAAAFALLFSLASCNDKDTFTPNPNNPPEQMLPQAAFTVTVCEREPGVRGDSLYNFYATLRSGHDYDSVDFNAVNTGTRERLISVQDDRLDLALTPWNTILFEASAPVNASSSAEGIDIVRIDSRHFRLSAYQKDCETTVSFWNGAAGAAGTSEGNSRLSVKVRAAASIPCTGFLMRYDGKDFVMQEPVPYDGYVPENEPYVNKYLFGFIIPYSVHHGSWNRYCMGTLTSKGIRRTAEEVKELEKDPFTWYFDPALHYKPNGFKTVELVGTIPRNATPDNRVGVVYDDITMRYGGYLYDNTYFGGMRHMEDFRWLMTYLYSNVYYREDGSREPDNDAFGVDLYPTRYLFPSQQVDVPPAMKARNPREGEYSDMELDMYPADMRYLKAEVFNGSDHYFSYRIGGSGEKGGKGEKQFWAYIYGNKSSYHKYINQY